MDTFFQKLRDIQKKERNTGTLSEVDDSFYTDASNYLQELLKMVDNNPLSLEAYQLRDAQRITTEICERREFKIVSTAATNVQKAHDLFRGHKKDSELYDVIPYNTTPEEEEFYKKIVQLMIDHREALMEDIILNKRSNKPKIGFKPENRDEDTHDIKTQNNPPQEKTTKVDSPKEDVINNPVLDETQIAMMFGKAPDTTIMDENNNPVKEIKTSDNTPTKKPQPPEEDTITLQNEEEEEKTTETQVTQEEQQAQITDEQDVQEKPENESTKEQITQEEQQDETTEQQIETEQLDESKNDAGSVEDKEEIILNEEELVLFKEEIGTDVLDENEKTYGPFLDGDIVLLPQSLVNILSRKDVVRIIR